MNAHLPATLCLVLALGCGAGTTPAAPTIASFTPSSGEASATTITVTGTGFGTVSGVTLGGVAVPSGTGTVASTTQLSFTVPAAAVTGPIAVTTPGGTATSATDFIVVPAITGLSPTSGAVGTAVTVTGSGLLGIAQIQFGTTLAKPSTWTAEEIIVPVPEGAVPGALTITFQVDSVYGLPNLLSAFTVES